MRYRINAFLRRVGCLLTAVGMPLMAFSAEPLTIPIDSREHRRLLCPADFVPPLVKPEKHTDTRIHVSADQAQIQDKAITAFEGKVRFRQGNSSVEADTLRYDRNSGELEVTSQLRYQDDQWQIEGRDAQLNLQQHTGVLHDTHYANHHKVIRGEAQSIEMRNKHRLVLNQASYTSCPADNVAWQLSAGRISLNNENQQGSAENVLLQFMGLPILYLPYMRFPIGDQRLSGFLYPGFGTSERHGTEINIPYYWNIAPQYDATINPHYMAKRGLMLETEFRYLGKTSKGKVDINYLPDDNLFLDNRSRLSWTHDADLEEGWSTGVSYQKVSDTQYLSDFSNSLSISSITHLDRRGQLKYNSPRFEFTLQGQDYQAITGSEAYKRLPQINFNTRITGQDNRLNYDLNSELVRFDHNDKNQLVGNRLRFAPYISYPISTPAMYFVPKVSLHHLQYDLDRLSSPTQSDSPSVTLPVYSLDAGLFLERHTQFGDTQVLHTLEPRLYYLYVPFKDQSALPIFDTGLTTFNEVAMFAESRFSGGDRIGDANQLAAAISTRLYRQDNGHELFSATAGELFFFSDRRVTLPGASVDDTTRSSLFGTVTVSPNRAWQLRGDIQWNPDNTHTEVGNTRLQYRPTLESTLNFDYRFRRNELRTYGASAAWRFSPRWRVFAGHQFDLQNNHKLENVLGIQYDSCCWGIRLLGVERFDTINSSNSPLFDKAIYLTFQLKGLSSFGQQNDIRTILEQSIYGYTH